MPDFIDSNQSSLILLLLILGGILLIWVVYLQIRLLLANKKRKEMFKGVKVTDLEELLLNQVKQTKQNSASIQELSNFLKKLSAVTDLCIKKVSLMRYNPFDDSGGDQSFAVALLDSFDNGIIISSLHSREGTRIYAKPIEKGVSKHHLSDEEKAVLQKAIENK